MSTTTVIEGVMASAGERAAPASDAAWRAVLERDRTADGSFVYGVRTTGIYCRPSCASRRPRRENVRFFASPAQAEHAGLRACRRCRPRQAAGADAEARVMRARAYLDTHAGEPVTLERLAREVGMSPYHLQRVFTREVGLSPKRYADARRIERFRARLQEGDTVSRATFEAGFGSSSALYAAAGASLGMSPAAYRKGGAGEQVRFATRRTSLGELLVAATERGVCAVSLGESARALEEALRAELPRAELIHDDAALDEWTTAIAAGVERGESASAIPVELHGTEFQMRVWRALREIPAGSTRSYGEVAAALGRPGSARAVARACASNRVALVVPCHRVVREDGGISGYRWGPERKRQLLERERTAARGGAAPARRRA